MKNKSIVLVTGTHGSGKGTLVRYLCEELGFKHFSCRSFLLEKVDALEMPRDRNSLNFVSNLLREIHGPEYVAYSVYKRAQNSFADCAVVESIYTVAEIEKIRAAATEAGQEFVLVAVDADECTRHARIQERMSETDRVTLEEFIAQEKRETESSDPKKHNLKACRQLATVVFDNSGSISEFHDKIDRQFVVGARD